MASTVAVIPRSSFQSFTPFTRLPLEIRCIIWRLTLLRRIVEIFPSESGNGFYSRATLPVALQVCQESKRAVEHLYPAFFGSFLQPESIRFNVNLDILYLDIHLEQECLLYFLGMLKETELRALKYVALDAEYLVSPFRSLGPTSRIFLGPSLELRLSLTVSCRTLRSSCLSAAPPVP